MGSWEEGRIIRLSLLATMGSWYKRALKILDETLQTHQRDGEPPPAKYFLRLITHGGIQDWPRQVRFDLTALVDRNGDLDDSGPEGDEWAYWISTDDPIPLIRELSAAHLATPYPGSLTLTRIDREGSSDEVLWSTH
jgi:hypothetical protein